MKKDHYIVFGLMLFLIFISNVNGAELSLQNVCEGNSALSTNGSCGDELSVSSTSTSELSKTPSPEPKGVVPLDVIVLIDDSGSMRNSGYSDKSNGYSNKLEGVNKIFKTIAEQVFDYSEESTIRYCHFNDYSADGDECNLRYSLKDFNSGKNVLEDDDLGGYTYIQKNYKKAYNSLIKNHGFKNSTTAECANNSSTPMVILITDGYANHFDITYAINSLNDSNKNDSGSSLGASTTARIAYYTLRTMEQLKEKICGLKLITIGVGMNPNDAFAKYLLDPSENNYKSLRLENNKSTISTASQTLYDIVNKEETTYSDYEFVASLAGSMEYGLFSGTLDETNNGRQRITFDFGNNGNGLTTQFRRRWKCIENPDESICDKDKFITNETSSANTTQSEDQDVEETNYSFRFYISVSKKVVKKDHSKILDDISEVRLNTAKGKVKLKVCTKGVARQDSNCNLILIRRINKGNNGGYLVFGLKWKDKYKTNDGEFAPKDLGIKSIQFIFNKSSVKKSGYFKKISITDMEKGTSKNYAEHLYSRDDNIVRASFVGSVDEIVNFIDIKKWSDDSEEEVVKEFTKVKHSVCTTKSTKLTSLYVKTSDIDSTKTFYNYDKTSGIKGEQTTCAAVTLSIPTLITTSSKIKFSVPSSSIYAGGGFSWDGAKLTNTVQWYYGSLTEAKEAIFTVGYNLAYEVTSGRIRSVASEEKTISEISLYQNNSCTGNKVDSKTLDSLVWKSLSNTIIDKNKSYSGAFMSINSNEKSEFQNFDSPVSVNTSSNEIGSDIINSNSLDQNGTKELKVESNVSLQRAYIDPTTAKVTYSNETLDGKIDGGQLYYVPLKFPDGKQVYVKTNGSFNFSVVSGITLKFSNSCPVNVKQILYDCPDSDCKKATIKYTYRPIDVDNPFPKYDNIPANWSWWYSKPGSQERLSNTYQEYFNHNPLYSITLNDETMEILKDIDTFYGNWSSMESGVTSDVVTELGIFDSRATNESYCGLGRWSESCDKQY